MKKIGVVVLGVVSLSLAQVKPPLYQLNDPPAGNPLHAVWVVKISSLGALQTSVNSVLTTMSWKVLQSGTGRPPLPALSMSAVRYPTSDPNKRLGLFIDVDMGGTNARIMADWYQVVSGLRPKVEAKQFYDEFFRRLAEALK